MVDLDFAITGAEPVPYAASPLLALKLKVMVSPNAGPINGAMVRCQVQIDVTRRRHDAAERERLRDLFGTADLWDRAVRPLHWAQVTVMVPRFDGATTVDLEVPCTQDLAVAVSHYLDSLEGGTVPVRVLFSGSIFCMHGQSAQILPIPHSHEASFDLPVATWKDLLAAYFPNAVFLPVRRDLYDRLRRIQGQSTAVSVDDVIELLLARVELRGGAA